MIVDIHVDELELDLGYFIALSTLPARPSAVFRGRIFGVPCYAVVISYQLLTIIVFQINYKGIILIDFFMDIQYFPFHSKMDKTIAS